MTRRLRLFLNALALHKVQRRQCDEPLRICELCLCSIVKDDHYRKSGSRHAHELCYKAAVLEAQ